ncbi:TetR/AcrR family transcriptional regulator [Thalassococcus lentus]|uniref:TetR/AcrR family transcriptional regulator n=1 Tax=Thalassococcus lentus TaxID=1210524 RepID=A0ABT4XQ36_9RHOB|nr:TetR/AcrR family transcriptional regulator [Thalassococcus lentus]MDA7424069.1 TetR/AcrR family transcriptional regulator [Thalassococcus lentus]
MARTQGSHAQITGPRIREAALHLFAEHGFAAVSMRQIAAKVGVQAGALYNYTPDKQALLFSLLKGHMDELLSAAPDQTTASPQDRLETFVKFHIEFHLQRHEAVFISYMELRNLTAENFEVIESLRRAYENRLETILRDGVAAGVFSVHDTKLTTMAIIAMLTGITTWYRDGGRLSADEVSATYCDMVRKAVGAL